jgi:hypothetical protein
VAGDRDRSAIGFGHCLSKSVKVITA